MFDDPGLTHWEPVEIESEKPVPRTVRGTAVDALKEPDDPLTTTSAIAYGAELAAFSVSTLVPVVEAGENDAVTPLGRPEAVSATLPLNPPRSLTVMVVVTEEPGFTERLPEVKELERVNPAAVRLLMRFWPFGDPHPVTRS